MKRLRKYDNPNSFQSRLKKFVASKFHDLELFCIKRGWPFGPIVVATFAVLCIPFLLLVLWNTSQLPKGEMTQEYVLAKIIRSNSQATEYSPLRVTFYFELPDGTRRTASTKSGAIYGQITDTACVKLRKEIDTDRSWVTLVSKHKCS